MMDHAVMASMMCVAMYPFEVHNYCLCISQEVHFYTRLSSPLSNVPISQERVNLP
jgi:hypothetical protein